MCEIRKEIKMEITFLSIMLIGLSIFGLAGCLIENLILKSKSKSKSKK